MSTGQDIRYYREGVVLPCKILALSYNTYCSTISHKGFTSRHLVPFGKSISVIYNLHVWCVVLFHFHTDSFSALVLSNNEHNTFNLKVSAHYYSTRLILWCEGEAREKTLTHILDEDTGKV